MKKNIRYVIYALLAIIGLLGLIVLLLPFFFPPEQIKALLMQELRQRLQRPIVIESAEVRFFPRPRLLLKNVKVEDGEGFSAEPFLTAKELKIRIQLLPLLSKRVVIEDFLLDRPRLKLEKNGQGSWNWESWAPPKPASQEEKEPAGEKTGVSPLILGILSMRVRQGEIEVRDETRNPSRILNLQAVNIDSSSQWRGKEGNLKFKARAQLQEGTLRGKGALIIAKGQSQPEVDLDFNWENLKLLDLKGLGNYFSWPSYLGAQGTLSGQGQAQGRKGKWEYQTQMELSGGEVSWERTEGKLRLKGDGSFTLAGGKKEGTRAAALLFAKEGSWSYPLEGKKKEGKLQWTNLKGKVDYTHQHLEIIASEFDFYGGKGKGKFLWNYQGARGRMNLEVEVEEAKVEELMTSAFPPKNPVEGVLKLTFKATGEGNNWQELKRSAEGNGDIYINNFNIKGFDFKDPLAEMFLAMVGGSDQEREKKSSVLKGKFFISEGKVYSDDLNLSAPWYSAEAKGNYDLVDSVMKLKGRAKSVGQKIDFQVEGPLSKLYWKFKTGQVDLKFDLGKPKKKKKKQPDTGY